MNKIITFEKPYKHWIPAKTDCCSFESLGFAELSKKEKIFSLLPKEIKKKKKKRVQIAGKIEIKASCLINCLILGFFKVS